LLEKILFAFAALLLYLHFNASIYGFIASPSHKEISSIKELPFSVAKESKDEIPRKYEAFFHTPTVSDADSREFEENHLRTNLASRGNEDRLSRTKSMDYTEEDLYWLSRIVQAEAPQDTDEGQIAVANVVLNRLDEGWSDSIKGVIFQVINGTHQFTPVKDGKIYNTPSSRSTINAKKALTGERILPPNVLYFYMPRAYNQNDWIRTRSIYKEIGIHRFCY
jgi:N-acetylmuramoyl-L-alanine amidase